MAEEGKLKDLGHARLTHPGMAFVVKDMVPGVKLTFAQQRFYQSIPDIFTLSSLLESIETRERELGRAVKILARPAADWHPADMLAMFDRWSAYEAPGKLRFLIERDNSYHAAHPTTSSSRRHRKLLEAVLALSAERLSLKTFDARIKSGLADGHLRMINDS